jgi:multiple sugar transport system permease protein
MNTLDYKVKKKNRILPYILIAPLGVWLIATLFIPVINVIAESVMDTTYVGTKGTYVGFKNYLNVLKDGGYWKAWVKSLQWVVGCTVLQTLLGFATALLVNGNKRIQKLAKNWMIIPWIIPTIVVGIMWQWIFNGSYGILNNVLLELNMISKPLNLIGGSGSMWTLVFINVWHWFPFTAVILLAGLATIPKELYESAAVDGANGFKKFMNITLPGLSNVTFALGVVGTLWCFNIFDIIWTLTSGGPLDSTTTVPIYIYRGAFKNFKIGRTSAASVITSLFLLIFALVMIKVTKPKEE